MTQCILIAVVESQVCDVLVREACRGADGGVGWGLTPETQSDFRSKVQERQRIGVTLKLSRV